MIHVRISSPEAQEIVTKAIYRSFTRGSIHKGSDSDQILFTHALDGPELCSKIIIFGKYPAQFKAQETVLGKLKNDAIHYGTHPLTQNLHLKSRAFERYDFTKEWNNLGYGAISKNDSVFGIADPSHMNDGDSFVSVFDLPKQSILWVNRPVGLIDGFDWRIIEDFISDYRADVLASFPVLSEIPAGYSAAATMRIDCDEAIETGRTLFKLYEERKFPFSLAIKTDQDFSEGSLSLMKELLRAGGSIVTHSHSHACDWGESPSRPGPKSKGAKWEVATSLEVLKKHLPDYEIDYAVSPFHQNPRRAVQGIARAGIKAFVGGIICNDPEYLIARSGEVPFAEGIISHSEQCMFHGDCYHNAKNTIQVYKDAFLSAKKTGTFFGFLDHPFSSYHYGWGSEVERVGVHRDFLDFLDTHPGLWKASLKDALDFMMDRASVKVKVIDGKVTATKGSDSRSFQDFQVRWKGTNSRLLF